MLTLFLSLPPASHPPLLSGEWTCSDGHNNIQSINEKRGRWRRWNLDGGGHRSICCHFQFKISLTPLNQNWFIGSCSLLLCSLSPYIISSTHLFLLQFHLSPSFSLSLAFCNLDPGDKHAGLLLIVGVAPLPLLSAVVNKNINKYVSLYTFLFVGRGRCSLTCALGK